MSLTEFLLLLLVLLILVRLFLFYKNAFSLPAGPFPLPLIGNYLYLCTKYKQQSFEIFDRLREKYGPIFTLHFGSDATIVVTDPQVILKMLSHYNFAGKTANMWTEEIYRPGTTNISFADFTREWEIARKIGHSSLRKIAVSNQLVNIVNRATDEFLDYVGDKRFDSGDLSMLLVTVSANWIFGQDYRINDPRLRRWEQASRFVNENSDLRVINFSKSLRFLFKQTWTRFKEATEYLNDFAERLFIEGTESEGCSSLRQDIKAATESMRGKVDQDLLSKQNQVNICMDLLISSNATFFQFLKWTFFLMSKYPDKQSKLREEIDRIVGSDEPTLEHMNDCDYVRAFMYETLRFRIQSKYLDIRYPSSDVEIAGHKIKKGTMIFLSLYHALHDEQAWGKDASMFKPETFLSPETGGFVSKPNPYFLPFGGGRRSCPGDKYAMSITFLVISKLLQRTTAIEVPSVESLSVDGKKDVSENWSPPDYELIFSRHD